MLFKYTTSATVSIFSPKYYFANKENGAKRRVFPKFCMFRERENM
jgi:hypothetical protein